MLAGVGENIFGMLIITPAMLQNALKTRPLFCISVMLYREDIENDGLCTTVLTTFNDLIWFDLIWFDLQTTLYHCSLSRWISTVACKFCSTELHAPTFRQYFEGRIQVRGSQIHVGNGLDILSKTVTTILQRHCLVEIARFWFSWF